MNLKDLIKGGESETMEFKKSLQLKDEIGKTVSAFSNCKGGRVIVGIDNNNPVGAEIGKSTIEVLANYIKQHTDPQVFPQVTVRGADSKDIVIIEVKESCEKPVLFKGRAYKRVGKSTHRISAGEIRELARESGGKIYWDEQVCENANPDDINDKKVKWFLRKANAERNFDVDPETPVNEALERLGLIRRGKLTNAAVLLFGRKPQEFFLQAETRCARFKGTEPLEFIDMKVFGGNVIDQRDDAVEFVKEHIRLHAKIVDVERVETWEYPIEAVREAITNAICHRGYELASNVQVRIFDDRIEVWGCGPLPKPLTLDNLKKKHDSVLRNRLIGKNFFLIKYIERWGTGTNRIINECLKHGLPEPLFELISGCLVVTFRKSKLTEEHLNALELNERQKRAIKYLEEHGQIDRKTYCNICDVRKTLAHEELSDMVSKDIVKIVGRGRGACYTLRT